MQFDVSWSGSDSGSGIANDTVYVSDDGSAYVTWQSNVAATRGVYTGVSGHSLYVHATDGASNSEAAKTVAKSSITVSAGFPDPAIGSSGVSGGGGCNIGGDAGHDPTLPISVLFAVVSLSTARWRKSSTVREQP